MARILIAEDTEGQLLVLRCYVRSGGHEVCAARNGLEAFQTLERDPEFDLLITDMMMPVMDGRELILTLRGSGAFDDLPIVIVSAVDKADVQDLIDLQYCRYVAKPLRQAELLEAVDRSLDPELA